MPAPPGNKGTIPMGTMRKCCISEGTGLVGSASHRAWAAQWKLAMKTALAIQARTRARATLPWRQRYIHRARQNLAGAMPTLSNTKIQLMKRQAYGFCDHEVLQAQDLCDP
jgi:hypothetical protein